MTNSFASRSVGKRSAEQIRRASPLVERPEERELLDALVAELRQRAAALGMRSPEDHRRSIRDALVDAKLL